MSYSVFEVEEGMLFEVLKERTKYVANNGHIAWFQCKVESVFTARDMLSIIGLQAPTQR
ncbi:MAG: hypothetical protein WED04_13015 [Promethearchaeati archaeon SRVP18_Atabeyarchaeia-1]